VTERRLTTVEHVGDVGDIVLHFKRRYTAPLSCQLQVLRWSPGDFLVNGLLSVRHMGIFLGRAAAGDGSGRLACTARDGKRTSAIKRVRNVRSFSTNCFFCDPSSYLLHERDSLESIFSNSAVSRSATNILSKD